MQVINLLKTLRSHNTHAVTLIPFQRRWGVRGARYFSSKPFEIPRTRSDIEAFCLSIRRGTVNWDDDKAEEFKSVLNYVVQHRMIHASEFVIALNGDWPDSANREMDKLILHLIDSMAEVDSSHDLLRLASFLSNFHQLTLSIFLSSVRELTLSTVTSMMQFNTTSQQSYRHLLQIIIRAFFPPSSVSALISPQTEYHSQKRNLSQCLLH